MRTPALPLLSLILTSVALLPAQSRLRILTLDGDAAGDRFGTSVHAAGDVDADGVPDFVVGAPEDDDNGAESGSVTVYSGANGSVLHHFAGPTANARFGTSVSGAGDVNGDGHADIVVGAIGIAQGSMPLGAAYVYSGADGSLLHSWVGGLPFALFGRAVRAAGDVNADGYDDVIVAAPPLLGTGNAFVFSGRDGTALHQFLVEGIGDVVDGAGDVDGDGFDDVVVGRPGDGSGGTIAGSAAAFSGRDRTRLWSVQGLAFEQMGIAVAAVGDVNGDGHDDVAVGATQTLSGGNGRVLVISGADGTTLHTLTGAPAPVQFGVTLDGGADVDGDGVGDVVVGAPTESVGGVDTGAAHVFSGATGAPLNVPLNGLAGDGSGDRFGTSVALVPDTDGDGLAEVLVGAPGDDDNGTDAGRAFLHALAGSAAPGRERVHGRACPGSNGNLPRIGFRGDVALGHALEIRLRGALPSTAGFLNLGDPTHIALDPYGLVGCAVYATPLGVNEPILVDANGLSRYALTVPAGMPALTGVTLSFQCVLPDPTANAWGITLSDALTVKIGG